MPASALFPLSNGVLQVDRHMVNIGIIFMIRKGLRW